MKVRQLSYSMMCTFMHCKMHYYLKYIEALELAAFHMPFFTGNCVNHGVQYILGKGKDLKKEIKKHMKKEILKIRTNSFLSIADEQAIEEQQIIIQGIVLAYEVKYKKTFVRTIKSAESEYVVVKEFAKEFRVKIKIDNLIKSKAGMVLHELKTSKTLNAGYVKKIQSDFQTTLYFHIYNNQNKDNPIKYIVYDVIRKPSIRLKQNESKPQYLKRLGAYYKDDSSNNLFHMESRKKPIVSYSRVINTIKGVYADMVSCTKPKHYFCNYNGCFSDYGKCDYYELCYAETREEYDNIRGTRYKLNRVIIEGRKHGSARKKDKR